MVLAWNSCALHNNRRNYNVPYDLLGRNCRRPFIFISKTPLPFRWQLLIFALLTVALIVFTRPFAVKKLKIGKENNTNVNALEGQEVLVVQKITKFNKGYVKAKNGVVWTAESEDSTDIQKDAVCIVKKVSGNTLVVARKE